MDYFAGLDISMDETHVWLSTATARSFTRTRQRRRRKRSPLSWRKRQVVGGSYSKQVEWPRSCSTGSANSASRRSA